MSHKIWFQQAEEDLKSAKYNLDGQKFYVCTFLCQQSVEKALKSVYIATDKKLIKTHDLLLLGKKVGLPNDLLEKAVLLNPYYTSSRYPFASTEKIDYNDASIALSFTKEVLEWCKKKIRI